MSFSLFQTKLEDLGEPPPLSEKSLRRLWVGLPIAVCGLLATALAAAVLVPLLINLRSEMLRAQRLQFLQDQLNEVNGRLARTSSVLKEADSQTSKLRNLLVGGGDRGTVLATLDNDAKATGVRLALYEQNTLPVPPGAAPAKPGVPPPAAAAVAKPPGSPAPGAPGAVPGAAPTASAAVEGVEEKPLLLSVQGTFPQILAFVQRLERLQVMVKQQDLSLAWDETKAPSKDSLNDLRLGVSPTLVMKLALVVFQATGDAAPKPPGAAPGAPGRLAPPGGRLPPAAPAARTNPGAAPIRPGPGSPPLPPAPPAFPPAGSSR
jgi:hypothetical protein